MFDTIALCRLTKATPIVHYNRYNRDYKRFNVIFLTGRSALALVSLLCEAAIAFHSFPFIGKAAGRPGESRDAMVMLISHIYNLTAVSQEKISYMCNEIKSINTNVFIPWQLFTRVMVFCN